MGSLADLKGGTVLIGDQAELPLAEQQWILAKIRELMAAQKLFGPCVICLTRLPQ
jgi:hypothetical protein